MQLNNRRRVVIDAIGIVFLLILSVGTSTGSTTPRTQNEVSTLRASLSQPTDKLSERLTLLAQPANGKQSQAEQARALSLPESGAGSLLTSDTGALLADIRVTDTTPASLAALTAAGAHIIHVAPAYGIVTSFVQPYQLSALAAIDVVENVQEELRPMVGSTTHPAVSANLPAQVDCPSAVTSEGDAQLKANQARAAFGIDGTGVTVGVLSDSFNKNRSAPTTATTDVATGDLPGQGNPCKRLAPTNVLAESQDTNNNDEGRAMLQIVHDLAPGASLAFATANTGIFGFADNIRALHTTAGASVIVDDVSYFAEPFYQDGPVSVAIQDVAQQGVLYFTAAGNSNVYKANQAPLDAFSSYEASYRPIACPVLTLPNRTQVHPGNDCHSFNPSGQDPTFGITLAPGGGFQAILQWAEPWFGVTDNIDIYVVDENGQILTQVGGRNKNTGPNGTQLPFETIAYQNNRGTPQQVQLVIARAEGSLAPLLKTVFVGSSGVTAEEYGPSNSSDSFGPTIIGHSASSAAMTIGAVPYNDSSTPEAFSSRGPAVIYFGPAASNTPASPLPNADVRAKPEVAATDGGRTTFFGSSTNNYRFYGTSAAAPHAAAVGALMQQRAIQRGVPLYLGFAKGILQRTAAPVPNGSPQANGAGLIDAISAVYGVEQLQVQSVFLPEIWK